MHFRVSLKVISCYSKKIKRLCALYSENLHPLHLYTLPAAILTYSQKSPNALDFRGNHFNSQLKINGNCIEIIYN